MDKQYIDFYNKQYSEEELRKFVRRILSIYNWNCVSIYQNLSENFIQEFQDKVDWYCISRFQNLSENFIREFQDKIDWFSLRFNKKIQVLDEFTIEFDKKLSYRRQWCGSLHSMNSMINNQYHRILGPARILYNSKKEYWYRGKQVFVNSNEKYFEWLKYRNF